MSTASAIIRRFTCCLLGSLIWSCSYPLQESGAGEVPKIRVAIFRDLKSFTVSGKGIVLRDVKTYRKLFSTPAEASLFFQATPGGIRINRQIYPTRLLSISSEGQLKIKGRRFRGKLEIAEDKSDSLLVIDELDLEQYLVGLINLEISSKWQIEAVKAQAVVARTYALYKKQRRQEEFYDLEASVLDQVYAGSNPEDQRARYAVKQTRGEVLSYRGKVIPAYFHSNCGGRTEASRYLWSREDYPFLRGVKCGFCTEAPDYFWSYRLPLKKLERILVGKGLRVNGIQSLKVIKQSSSSRVLLLEITSKMGKTRLRGEKLRQFLGSTRLKSTNFQVKIKAGEVYFRGSGYGHGVGLCQWGAKGMAEEGYDYRSILKHYYPGVEIKSLY